MSRVDEHRAKLRTLADWEPFLLANSALPGPRGNLELVHAVAEEGTEEQFQRWICLDAAVAPENSPAVFLTVCGVVGLGRMFVAGIWDVLPLLRERASDPRWRVREAVAMALQRIGAANMDTLLDEMQRWCAGSYFEQRAAIAGLCEPVLLRSRDHVISVLVLLDTVTESLANAVNRREDGYRVLRQALGYCWSVAVVAQPCDGKAAFAKWLTSHDPDVRWVMRDNLSKNRLARMDAPWVEGAKAQLAQGSGPPSTS